MPTPAEIETAKQKVVAYIIGNREDKAVSYVKQNAEVFPELPESLRDNDQIALAAMGRYLQVGTYASDRIKSNIDIFIKAFQTHFNHPPLVVSSARDLIFALKFSQQFFHYWHKISDDNVVKWFSCSPSEAQKEILAARILIKIAERYDWIRVEDKEESISYLTGC